MSKQTSTASDQFFLKTDITVSEAEQMVKEGLEGADYGELYLERTKTEGLAKDKGQYTGISVGNSKSGFGFRVGQEERVAYTVSDIFNKAALKDSIAKARKILKTGTSKKKRKTAAFGKVTQELYTPKNPMASMTLQEKLAGLDKIEAYAKSLDNRIVNVSVSYSAASKDVHIITADGQSLRDTRPMVSLHVSLTLKDENGRTEMAGGLLGGRIDCTEVFDEKNFKGMVDNTLKQAQELMIAGEAPAGEMEVVLANGWNAVLIHEAVGHGLEGDPNYKKKSVYSGHVGEKVAGSEVTIIDQGDMPGERGSLQFDDEGTPTQQNVLIENGVLKGYMQDRKYAQLMDVEPTGNGRRQDYTHVPLPRMTNTFIANGTHDPEDIIKGVKYGLYVTNMSGGQVDTTSGQFNFVATLAYIIRDGKVCKDEPVKGATLVGDGLSVINAITKVGNDLKIERNAGMCGKGGQTVPVSCGQPTVHLAKINVGGTKK